ncbi:MAG: hypothetical protein NUV67_04285 [archaeon]|nr:hypothetical protein [archaeon]
MPMKRSPSGFEKRKVRAKQIDPTGLSDMQFHQVHGNPRTSDVHLVEKTKGFVHSGKMPPEGPDLRRIGRSYQRDFGEVYEERRGKKPKDK